MEHLHLPVMLKEAIDALNIQPDGFYVDGTFGRGGHSQLILSKLGPNGRLLLIDKDPQAIDHARQLFSKDPRVSIEHGSFAQLPLWTKNHPVNGVLLDLGVSSPQLEDHQRGFSFMRNGPLDMRMNTKTGEPLSAWLATVDQNTLIQVLFELGEERAARRIANAILTEREKRPLQTTQQLSHLVSSVMPSKQQLGKHPATRTFQAFRLFINHELDELRTGLVAIQPLITLNGRLAVMSFHSLEDRITKHFMQAAVEGPVLPRKIPLQHHTLPKTWRWHLKQQKPSALEQSQNPRSRSAILRVIEKI